MYKNVQIMCHEITFNLNFSLNYKNRYSFSVIIFVPQGQNGRKFYADMKTQK